MQVDKFVKIQPLCVLFFVDVSAMAAAFVGTNVHQVSLWQTVSSHRYGSHLHGIPRTVSDRISSS